MSNGTSSDPATATINVATLTPQVIGYSTSVNEDSSIGLNLCSTAPAAPVTFSIVNPPQEGALDQMVAPAHGPTCPAGYFNFGYERYVPNQLYSGTDLIGFTSTAGGRTSTEAIIHLTVDKVEIPPTATPQTVQVLALHPVDVTLSGSSLQGSTLTYRVTSGPSHGTLSGTAPDLVYTPSVTNGSDSFTFVANDGTADSVPATVTLDITTPRLTSSACYAGAPVDPGQVQFTCSGNLTPVAGSPFGTLELAHTSGNPGNELRLQETITNDSTVADTVTLTAPAGTSQWPFLYDEGGSDVTAELTGPGLTVTLGPGGTSAASIYVQIITFSPLTLPAPAVVSTRVLATSGNDATVSTQVPIEIQDGTSSPTLTLAQADGSGGVSFPTSLQVAPPLYGGGPAGGVDILAGINGTGINTFVLHAQIEAGSTPGITPTFYLASLNVTAAVLAGTEVVTCYAGPAGCPPLRAVLTPGTGSGTLVMEISLTSTIDGQGAFGFAAAQLAGTVGPDLFTINPNVGTGVYETTPLTQVVSTPTELSGTSTQRVFLQNHGDVSDTFTIRGAVTRAAGDTSTISFAANAPGYFGNTGVPVDRTGSITNGTYTVTIPASDYVEIDVSDAAAATTATAPPQVVLTATSLLDPTKVDSYQVTFPTYFYRPDAILAGPDGSLIGAGVYQQSYPGPLNNSQEATYDIDQQPRTIDVTLADRGQGHWAANDAVVIKAPTVDSSFTVELRAASRTALRPMSPPPSPAPGST